MAAAAIQAAADSRLESIMSGMKRWTDEERARYCEDMGEHPLFSPMPLASRKERAGDALPEVVDAAAAAAAGGGEADGVEAVSGALKAIANVEYDELDSPKALALECKEKGNAAFAQGKSFYGHAIKHYTDAIRHALKALGDATGAGDAAAEEFHTAASKAAAREEAEEEAAAAAPASAAAAAEMKKVASQCGSNLAAIYLARGKFITVVEACDRALRLWPDNVKACWRAAKACLAMGRAAAALQFCELGTTIDPDTRDFADLVKEGSEMLARQERMAAEAAKEEARKARSLAALRRACTERGIRVGPPMFSGMRRTAQEPFVDAAEGVVHWPVLLLYPESGQSDYLEDVAEVATLGDMLEAVLPGGSGGAGRLPWDVRGEYRLGNVEVFYRSNPCKPLPIEQAWTTAAVEAGPEDSYKTTRWVRVPAEAPLLLPLVQESYVLADIPVFYLVARTSGFYAEMKRLARGGDFVTLSVPEMPAPPE